MQLELNKDEINLLYNCLLSTQQFVKTILPCRDNILRIKIDDNKDVSILSLFLLQKKLEDFLNIESNKRGEK